MWQDFNCLRHSRTWTRPCSIIGLSSIRKHKRLPCTRYIKCVSNSLRENNIYYKDILAWGKLCFGTSEFTLHCSALKNPPCLLFCVCISNGYCMNMICSPPFRDCVDHHACCECVTDSGDFVSLFSVRCVANAPPSAVVEVGTRPLFLVCWREEGGC